MGVGNPRNGGGLSTVTHGWVLPEMGKQRFAVTWNGLVYPVITVGPPTDLHADVNTMLASIPVRRFRAANVIEQTGISVTNLLPIRICLLERLGENDLAAKAWSKLIDENPGGFPHFRSSHQPEVEKETGIDPYLDMANDLAWSHFERAVTAHMRGDTRLPLAPAQFLNRFQPLATIESEKRGFEPIQMSVVPSNSKPSSYFKFLPQLPMLLTDWSAETVNRLVIASPWRR